MRKLLVAVCFVFLHTSMYAQVEVLDDIYPILRGGDLNDAIQSLSQIRNLYGLEKPEKSDTNHEYGKFGYSCTGEIAGNTFLFAYTFNHQDLPYVFQIVTEQHEFTNLIYHWLNDHEETVKMKGDKGQPGFYFQDSEDIVYFFEPDKFDVQGDSFDVIEIYGRDRFVGKSDLWREEYRNDWRKQFKNN